MILLVRMKRIEDRYLRAPVRNLKEARYWNKQGWGIFWTPNSFDGRGQTKHHVTKVLNWYVDIDKDKTELGDIWNRLPAKPTRVVETKNGYHLYWRAKNATIEGFSDIAKAIMQHIPESDHRVIDISRLLRVPNFYHWKDQNDPFLVKTIYKNPRAYTERQMRTYFPHTPAKKVESSQIQTTPEIPSRKALERLSGTKYVKGEIFSFCDNSDGSQQILVNGKRTGCWIDQNDFIGSYGNGGPTIIQWLKWYDNSYKEILEAIEMIDLQFTKKS